MQFLERSAHLAELHERLQRATSGHGQVILVGGEAGVGKSTLVRELRREVAPQAHVLLGTCDPISTPRALGPLFDMADELGEDVERLLLEGASPVALFRSTLRALASSGRPTLLIIEDVQWADEATLDLIRYIARRLDDIPVALVATYRDDEVGPTHQLTTVLGELLRLPPVARIIVPPLSPEAVSVLAAGRDVDAADLHRQTGGNPFYVTEVLAAGPGSIPDTVRDAVLARVSRLPPAARRVLDAAAVLGPRADPSLLSQLTGLATDELVVALDECLASGVLQPESETVGFRHELARGAILHAISPLRRAALHQRVLRLLTATPSPVSDPAWLAHHAEAAGDAEAVLRYAPAAAQHSAAFGAHREALAQYERALRFAGRLPADQRADLLSAASSEAFFAGQWPASIETRRAAIGLRRKLGDRPGEAHDLRHLSRLLSAAFEPVEAETAAHDALALLETMDPGAELAMVYSTCSQLDVLAGRGRQAIEWGEKAIALATRLGEVEPLVHALNNVGFARLKMGDQRGRDELEQSLQLALDHGFEDHVARAYINLASAALRSCQLDPAERHVTAGIGYCTDHDLEQYRLYLLLQCGLVLLFRGRWEEAEKQADALLASSADSLTRATTLTLRGRVRVRRGEQAIDDLTAALELAERSDQPVRLVPARAALAEAAWLAGDDERALLEARHGLELVLHRDEPGLLGDVAVWLKRIGGATALPPNLPPVPEPYAHDLAGDWASAAASWQARGCPYEAAMSLLASCDETALRQALDILTDLGARLAAGMVTRKLRSLGVRDVPRGPRPSTRLAPGNLTGREVAVLRLVAQGLHNSEIADRLFVSPHTVAHHVSAILAKLDARSRAEAVDIGTRLGVFSSRDDG